MWLHSPNHRLDLDVTQHPIRDPACDTLEPARRELAYCSEQNRTIDDSKSAKTDELSVFNPESAKSSSPERTTSCYATPSPFSITSFALRAVWAEQFTAE